MGTQKESFYAAVLIIAVVVGLIILYFIISIVRQQRRNVLLLKKSAQTEIDTLERERARMAADLHDEVGPVLSALKLRLNSLELSDPDDEEELQKTNAQIDRLMKRMREISFDLMPTSLLRRGLDAAVGEFIEQVGRHSPMRIHFEGESISLPQSVSINLYRIIQEITHNAIKHAQATELRIGWKLESKGLVLVIRDNGVGFNYESRLAEGKGMGLRNLLHRAEMMGGRMFLESVKGKGTTYIFEIPTASHEIDSPDQTHSGRRP